MTDASEYEAEAFYDEVYAQASTEAAENFTAERLHSFYDKEPKVAERPVKALAEARRLLETPHHTAAFIHAAIVSEVMLREVVLIPILVGFINSDSIAPFIVKLAISSPGLQRFEKLLAKVFQDVSNLDMLTHRRIGGAKALWEEIVSVQKRRNQIMHEAEVATKGDAEHAIAVATAVTEELFPVFAKSLGYHLHDGFRLCSEWICTQPEDIRKIFEQTQPAKTPNAGSS